MSLWPYICHIIWHPVVQCAFRNIYIKITHRQISKKWNVYWLLGIQYWKTYRWISNKTLGIYIYSRNDINSCAILLSPDITYAKIKWGSKAWRLFNIMMALSLYSMQPGMQTTYYFMVLNLAILELAQNGVWKASIFVCCCIYNILVMAKILCSYGKVDI